MRRFFLNSLDVGLEELDVSPGLLALLPAISAGRVVPAGCRRRRVVFLLCGDPPDGKEPDREEEELCLLLDLSISLILYFTPFLISWSFDLRIDRWLAKLPLTISHFPYSHTRINSLCAIA